MCSSGYIMVPPIKSTLVDWKLLRLGCSWQLPAAALPVCRQAPVRAKNRFSRASAGCQGLSPLEWKLTFPVAELLPLLGSGVVLVTVAVSLIVPKTLVVKTT